METAQQNTNQQYDFVIEQCKDIFLKKTADYGTAWRVLRTISITDQIYIKAQRIRTIQEKNHDYGEAWRNMSQESFVDLILMKLQRMRQIISNEGRTIMSEGLDANYTDIINYAVFALILAGEKNINTRS
jgi:hypothetical protein